MNQLQKKMIMGRLSVWAFLLRVLLSKMSLPNSVALYFAVGLLSAASFADDGFFLEFDLGAGAESISSGSSTDSSEFGLTGFFELGEQKASSIRIYAEMPFLQRKSSVSLRYREREMEIEAINRAGVGVADFGAALVAFGDDDRGPLIANLIERTDFATNYADVQTLDELATFLNDGLLVPTTGDELENLLTSQWATLDIESRSTNILTDRPDDYDSDTYELAARLVFGQGYIFELGYQQVDRDEYAVEYTITSDFPINILNSPVLIGVLDVGDVSGLGVLNFESRPATEWVQNGSGDRLFGDFESIGATDPFGTVIKQLLPFEDIAGQTRNYDIDQEVITVGGGAYLADAMSAVFRYSQSSTESEAGIFLMDYDQVEAEVKLVGKPKGAKGHLVTTVTLSRTEFDDIDEYSTEVSGLVSYAANRRLMFGGGATINTSSDGLYSTQTYLLNASYFITQDIGLELSGSITRYTPPAFFDDVKTNQKESGALRLFIRL